MKFIYRDRKEYQLVLLAIWDNAQVEVSSRRCLDKEGQ